MSKRSTTLLSTRKKAPPEKKATYLIFRPLNEPKLCGVCHIEINKWFFRIFFKVRLRLVPFFLTNCVHSWLLAHRLFKQKRRAIKQVTFRFRPFVEHLAGDTQLRELERFRLNIYEIGEDKKDEATRRSNTCLRISSKRTRLTDALFAAPLCVPFLCHPP